MTTTRTAHHVRIALALVFALGMAVVAGCGNSSTGATSSTVKPAGLTAKKALTIAMSTLSTAAPDGKVLVAQTAGPVSPTSTPVWEFLIGSPKSDVTYAVIVQDGKGQFQEYGQAGLKAEWASVPSQDAWKIDSDAALQKALAVYPGGKNVAYVAGFVTYVPKTVKDSTAKSMTWNFNFDPASKGTAATSTVEVDMSTGAAALAK